VGLGITSIGRVGDAYIQNVKELDQYDRLIGLHKLPVFKGVELDEDDKLRRAVITQLICHFELDFAIVEQHFNINVADYFADELIALMPMQADGLLVVSTENIQVLAAGRLLIRNICMVFDKYLAQKSQQFSKVI
jgi:oxygen-independent coproporphyrinogen-3 oxidase